MRKKAPFLFGCLMAAVASVTMLGSSTIGVPTAEAKNYIKLNRTAVGTTQTVTVGLNKSMVLDLPADAHDILVANPEVADAITRTSRRIYIFAKQVGSTNIFIFDSSGNQLLSVDLNIERDIDGLQAHLAKYIRGSDIKVEMLNDNVILTGTVATPQDSAKAVQLARIFVTGGEATTNQFSNNGTTGGSGTTIVFNDDEARQESQIVNLLAIDGEDQVHLKVTIAEIQRTVAKQLGIDLTTTGFSYHALSLVGIGDNPFVLNRPLNGGHSSLSFNDGRHQLDAMLRAMDQTGVMRTLAEPSLTAISGETAKFKVGGEYYISDGASHTDDGSTYSQRLVEYGVALAFRPVVLGPGRISLHIKTQVSEPTSEGSYSRGRTVYRSDVTGHYSGNPAGASPGIRRRNAETTVELPSGGSMVIAGLLRDDVRQTVSGFPGLHRIPVLGTLFKSREFQRYESELVIIATPYLVRPQARSALARPDDNFSPAGDSAGIFMNQLNKIYGSADAGTPQGQFHGNVGFIFK